MTCRPVSDLDTFSKMRRRPVMDLGVLGQCRLLRQSGTGSDRSLGWFMARSLHREPGKRLSLGRALLKRWHRPLPTVYAYSMLFIFTFVPNVVAQIENWGVGRGWRENVEVSPPPPRPSSCALFLYPAMNAGIGTNTGAGFWVQIVWIFIAHYARLTLLFQYRKKAEWIMERLSESQWGRHITMLLLQRNNQCNRNV